MIVPAVFVVACSYRLKSELVRLEMLAPCQLRPAQECEHLRRCGRADGCLRMMGHDGDDRVWTPPKWRPWLISLLFVLACANGIQAIVYSHRATANHDIMLQNQDIWTEAAFFAALCAGAAFLIIPARRPFIVAGAVLIGFLALLSCADLVNAQVITASSIGVPFLLGNLVGSSGALVATAVILLRCPVRRE